MRACEVAGLVELAHHLLVFVPDPAKVGGPHGGAGVGTGQVRTGPVEAAVELAESPS
jgi:hypothetical protein